MRVHQGRKFSSYTSACKYTLILNCVIQIHLCKRGNIFNAVSHGSYTQINNGRNNIYQFYNRRATAMVNCVLVGLTVIVRFYRASHLMNKRDRTVSFFKKLADSSN